MFHAATNFRLYPVGFLLFFRQRVIDVAFLAYFSDYIIWRTGYSSSKFAITGFLETIRLENLKNGLHVMIAYPGFTASEIRFHALTADGSAQGRTPRDEGQMMSSEETAAHILNGIRRKKQYQTSFTDKTVYLSKFFCKNLLNKVVYNMMAKEPDAPTNA